jgi:hypothetical protein
MESRRFVGVVQLRDEHYFSPFTKETQHRVHPTLNTMRYFLEDPFSFWKSLC